MTYTLNQWCVTVADNKLAMFTALNCDEETAMQIAVATFGDGVTKLEDEGAVRLPDLTNAQLHIANPDTCAECGQYKMHEDTCFKGTVTA